MRMQVTTATLPSTLSRTEELANVLTHGLGLLLSLAGAAIMVSLLGHGDSWRIAGCIIYLASLSGVYLMSTLSHTFETPRVRSFFRALDQGTIYFLIAATYTPFSMAYLHSWPWWLFLAVVWGVAFWGFFSKVFFAHRVEAVSMWPCIILGVIPFVSVPALVGIVDLTALWWMLIGIACYTLGLVFWVNDRRVKHFHAVWHILVIAGSACHFVCILLFVAVAQ